MFSFAIPPTPATLKDSINVLIKGNCDDYITTCGSCILRPDTMNEAWWEFIWSSKYNFLTIVYHRLSERIGSRHYSNANTSTAQRKSGWSKDGLFVGWSTVYHYDPQTGIIGIKDHETATVHHYGHSVIVNTSTSRKGAINLMTKQLESFLPVKMDTNPDDDTFIRSGPHDRQTMVQLLRNLSYFNVTLRNHAVSQVCAVFLDCGYSFFNKAPEVMRILPSASEEDLEDGDWVPEIMSKATTIVTGNVQMGTCDRWFILSDEVIANNNELTQPSPYCLTRWQLMQVMNLTPINYGNIDKLPITTSNGEIIPGWTEHDTRMGWLSNTVVDAVLRLCNSIVTSKANNNGPIEDHQRLRKRARTRGPNMNSVWLETGTNYSQKNKILFTQTLEPSMLNTTSNKLPKLRRKITKLIDQASKENLQIESLQIITGVNINGHFYLASFDIVTNTVTVMDSCEPTSRKVPDFVQDIATTVFDGMKFTEGGTWNYKLIKSVQQTNTKDCGIYVIERFLSLATTGGEFSTAAAVGPTTPSSSNLHRATLASLFIDHWGNYKSAVEYVLKPDSKFTPTTIKLEVNPVQHNPMQVQHNPMQQPDHGTSSSSQSTSSQSGSDLTETEPHTADSGPSAVTATRNRKAAEQRKVWETLSNQTGIPTGEFPEKSKAQDIIEVLVNLTCIKSVQQATSTMSSTLKTAKLTAKLVDKKQVIYNAVVHSVKLHPNVAIMVCELIAHGYIYGRIHHIATQHADSANLLCGLWKLPNPVTGNHLTLPHGTGNFTTGNLTFAVFPELRSTNNSLSRLGMNEIAPLIDSINDTTTGHDGPLPTLFTKLMKFNEVVQKTKELSSFLTPEINLEDTQELCITLSRSYTKSWFAALTLISSNHIKVYCLLTDATTQPKGIQDLPVLCSDINAKLASMDEPGNRRKGTMYLCYPPQSSGPIDYFTVTFLMNLVFNYNNFVDLKENSITLKWPTQTSTASASRTETFEFITRCGVSPIRDGSSKRSLKNTLHRAVNINLVAEALNKHFSATNLAQYTPSNNTTQTETITTTFDIQAIMDGNCAHTTQVTADLAKIMMHPLDIDMHLTTPTQDNKDKKQTSRKLESAIEKLQANDLCVGFTKPSAHVRTAQLQENRASTVKKRFDIFKDVDVTCIMISDSDSD